jgi:hypothetical protein
MVFFRTTRTGGTATALDGIDGTDRGDGNPLQELDAAFVMIDDTFYPYIGIANGLAESDPDIIRPDTNAGDFRWMLQGVASTIADASITLAKLADMATASLYYRKTAGTGVPEVNTLATLKTDLGLTGTNSGDNSAASTTVAGIVELAINTEVNAGSDATRAVTPDSLAGSNFGTKGIELVIFDFTTDITTGNGKSYFVVPDEMTGMNLVRVAATVITAGTTGSTTIGIYNLTDAQQMLSTSMNIETGETSTRTSATPGTIDVTKDDVVTGDILRIDVSAVSTTAPLGLIAELVFALP